MLCTLVKYSNIKIKATAFQLNTLILWMHTRTDLYGKIKQETFFYKFGDHVLDIITGSVKKGLIAFPITCTGCI